MDNQWSSSDCVGENVRQLRELHGLTLREVADRLSRQGHNLGINALSRIERRERRADADDIAALARVLEVGVHTLFVDPRVELEDAVRVRWEDFRDAYQQRRELEARVHDLGAALREVVQGDADAQALLRQMIVTEFGESIQTVEYSEMFLTQDDEEE
jgi:transcriptional regulator with XRE-family HTH domain